MSTEIEEGLTLRFETFEGSTAVEVGEILISLNASFQRFCKRELRHRSNVSLYIRDLKRGSLDIILEAIDGAGKVIKAGEAVAPFACHLMEIARILCGHPSPKIAKVDHKVIEAIAKPIASGNATQINLIVHGEAYFTFNGESAVALQSAKASSLVVSPSAAEVDAPPRYVSLSQVRSLSSDGLHGTALDVDGDWYARLEGGQGVLVPITASSAIAETLHHKAPYLFRGALLKGVRGEQIGIDVTDITRIGS